MSREYSKPEPTRKNCNRSTVMEMAKAILALGFGISRKWVQDDLRRIIGVLHTRKTIPT